MAPRLGFAGLGVMGGPMAGHLLREHGALTIWNRTPSKSEQLRSDGAAVAGSLEELGKACDIVFLCVNRSEDVREVVEGLLRGAAKGCLFVDHSTIAPPAAQQLASDLHTEGYRFVDAPVTGGSMGAQKGQLTIFCGGAENDVAEAMEAMKPYTKRAERMGPSGSGQMAKMANQIAVGGALLALCEALSFAKKAGLDVALTRELLAGGAGGSWAFDNYGPKILAEDWSPGFSIINQRKDFGYCREAATSIDAAIPGTQLVDELLKRLQDEGHGEWTTAALYEQIMRMGAAD
ncbi:MAG TPA: NAD(P)-dependent oxidoreductase [Fimbriimonas sp.]|nr:NAD(P)-dependent oxidoreductase [Fimbriimonas sp.]